MKTGILTFSYSGFPRLAGQFAAEGAFSANLGDNMQTIAARAALQALGLPAEEIVGIDRDTLPLYAGPPVRLVMNGCFYARCFPMPPAIRPVFFGFQADAAAVAAGAEWLRRHQPIGCRDPATAAHLQAAGIAAHVTGCITLTLPPRDRPPADPKVYVVFGAGAGELPATLLEHVPRPLLPRLRFVFQRKLMHVHPLPPAARAEAETHAALLLREYTEEAGLVITPLHHAAAPCLARGIPVILARRRADDRFGFLKTLLPVYLPADFAAIDWAPRLPDMAALRARMLGQLAGALRQSAAF